MDLNEGRRINMMGKIMIDLQSPDGDSFALLHLAKELGECLGKDVDELQREMTCGDRGYLIEVFQREFGDYVSLLNPPQRRKAEAAVTAPAQRGNEAHG
jgi:hypothetical protein